MLITTSPWDRYYYLQTFLMQLAIDPFTNPFIPLQQQDGPEPTHSDGSPFEFFPPAPVVLFCKNSPPLKKVIMQKQPITPQSASKKQGTLAPAAPRVPTRTRTTTRNVAARKTLRRRSPSPESSHVG